MSHETQQSARILLVEDEALIALSQKQSIETHGYEVAVVHSGEQAVEAASADRDLALVLMDIDLGTGMDGVEAAKRILEVRDVPILFLTSHTGQEYVDRVKTVSSYGYVVKDSDEFVLAEQIRLSLELFEARHEAWRQKTGYERLFNSSWNGLTSFDAEGRVRVMNPAAAARLGGVPEDFHGRTVWDFLPEYVARRGIASIAHVLATAETVTRESDVEIDGEVRWFDIRYQPVRGEQGVIVEVLQISDEVTEQVRAREECRESEARYRLLAENTVDVVYSLDAQLRPTYISPSVETLIGYPPQRLEEFKQATIFDFVVPEDKDRIARAIKERIAAGESFGVTEFAVQEAGGNIRWVENRARYIYRADGDLSAIVGTSRDITDRKKAEEELEATLEYKDQLMSELNHRVKNNLALVVSLVRLKQSAVSDVADLSDITNQINTIRSLHEKLQHSEDVSHVDAVPYLEDVVRSVVSDEHHPDVELEIAIDQITLPTKTATTLGLIVSELATNAVKHGFAGESKSRFAVTMRTDETTGEHVLTVSNTGREFPPDIHLEKPPSLGLQLVTALTGQLGGRLELQRSPVTVFTIRFPIPE
jgi:PAS domain S-box-containing protein